MWSHHWSFDWYLCSHFSDNRKNSSTIGRRMCLPFCSLLMKIMVLKDVHPPKDGKILVRLCPISMCLFKRAKVTLPKHLRVNLSLMPLLPVMAQPLTLRLGISRLHLLSLLSYRQLALNMYNLALKLIGWVLWLRVCISVFLDLNLLSTPPTIKFKFISRPLRHS